MGCIRLSSMVSVLLCCGVESVQTASAQVIELFQRFLGRDPTPDELSRFLDVLDEPGTTWRTAALALLTSPHYQYY